MVKNIGQNHLRTGMKRKCILMISIEKLFYCILIVWRSCFLEIFLLMKSVWNDNFFCIALDLTPCSEDNLRAMIPHYSHC